MATQMLLTFVQCALGGPWFSLDFYEEDIGGS